MEKRKKRRVTLLCTNYEALKEKAALADERYERLLRLQADFENAKKRMAKEWAEFKRYANEDLIAQFLPILDNFERALAHDAKGTDEAPLVLEGVRMIYKEMRELLTKYGLREIKSVGEKFDPNRHEVLMQVENKNVAEHTVVEELQKGYLLNDRVIRTAKVKVAVKKSNQ